MAPGGPRPALLLLLALLPPGLAWLFASRSAQDFVARHVDFPRSSPPPGQQYCDYLMGQGRSLPGPPRRSFTFVHADPSQLASLCRCGDGSQPRARTCVSRNRIPTTTCRRGLNCGLRCYGGLGGYAGGSLQRRRIRWLGGVIRGGFGGGLASFGIGMGGSVGATGAGPGWPYVSRYARRRIRVACRGGEPVGVLATV